MKLDYKILWLDDKIESVVLTDYEEDIEELKTYVKSLGFNETIDFVRTEEELFSKLDEIGEYDLIMTDYHLDETKGVKRNGDDIIKTIREKDIHTEIMFYSAQGEVKDTDRLDRITFFESYRVLGDDHYEKIFRKAKELIELTVRKFQNIVAMRGMIMHETSVIDSEMLEIVTNFIKASNSIEVKNRIYDELIGFHSRKLEDSQKFKKNDRIDKVLKDPLLISSSQRANAIEEIIKLIGIENFIDDLRINIIKVRNDFAHAVYVKDKETGREYFVDKQEGSDFNEEVCKSIRLNIIKHKNNLDLLKQKLL
jgi:CheY-like chemotaxis protein